MNKKTNLVIQSFGKESEFKRALLTIYSFYAYSSTPVAETRIYLFTDDPDYFKIRLQDLPVEYIMLTAEKIRQMRGSIDFLHRMKIALLEEAFNLAKENLLYTDSDTFFIADPAKTMEQVSEEKGFMHVHEYEFSELAKIPLPGGKPFRDFLKLIESRSFTLADGKQLKVAPVHSSWNAGVMLFHTSHARFIPDVYALTEQFYPATGNHASEQYAFSIVFQENTALSACDQMIYHYWHRVKKEIVDEFLIPKFSTEWVAKDRHTQLTEVREWTKFLPGYFEDHVLTLKDNCIQSLNENDFSKGYKWALKSFSKGALKDRQFVKDVLYHAKRQILKR